MPVVVRLLPSVLECVPFRDGMSVDELVSKKDRKLLVDLQVHTMVNGRERGLAFVATDLNRKDALVVFVAENRNSDDLFVQHTTCPAIKVFHEPDYREIMDTEAYERRRYFSYAAILETTTRVGQLVFEYLDTEECESDRT